jgi:hypothetical protein
MKKATDPASQEELYLSLAQIAKERNTDLARRWPRLSAFLLFIEANRQVNAVQLVREERQLVRQLHDRQAATGAEREVAFLSDFYVYLAEYLNNQISADDYDYFQVNLKEFEQLWPKYIAAQAALPESYGRLVDEFYRVNVERNRIFLKHMGIAAGMNAARPLIPETDHVRQAMESLKKGNTELIVLVSGGFHTDGVAELLKGAGVTYLVITPNVTSETKYAEEVYNKLAKEQATINYQTIALNAYSRKFLGLPVEKQFENIAADYVEAKLSLAFRDKTKGSVQATAKEIDDYAKTMGARFLFENRTGKTYRFKFVYTAPEYAPTPVQLTLHFTYDEENNNVEFDAGSSRNGKDSRATKDIPSAQAAGISASPAEGTTARLSVLKNAAHWFQMNVVPRIAAAAETLASLFQLPPAFRGRDAWRNGAIAGVALLAGSRHFPGGAGHDERPSHL